MRQGAALVSVLVLGLAGGCLLPEPAEPTSWVARARNAARPLPGNVVQMDVALLEVPVGDSFINGELWTCTDEQIVPLEKKGVVEENGFRVGQVVGMTPGKLLQLLTYERSCLNPRRRFLQNGYPATQSLSPVLAEGRFRVVENGEPADVRLDQVQYCLDVVPTLTDDGKSSLRFTPKVQFGGLLPDFRADPTGWTLQMERPHKTFSGLEWDVALAPNEYLVVGAHLDRPRSLGYQSFIQAEGPSPVQRLLVIRTARSAGDPTEGHDPTLEDLARTSHSPPLALQATMTSARASGR